MICVSFGLLSTDRTAHWTERQPAAAWRTTRPDTDGRQVAEVGLLPTRCEHAALDRHRSQSEQISGTFIEALLYNLTRKVSHNSALNPAAASPGDGFPPPPPLITSFSGCIAHLPRSGFPISHCYVSLGHCLV